MELRTLTRGVVTATAVLAGCVLGTAPAAATDAGAGVVHAAVGVGDLHGVAATLSYDATPFLGWTLVEFNCKAVAWYDPAATGIVRCEVAGVSAVNTPNNTPGAVAVAAGAVWVREGETPRACVQGRAYFAESILGPTQKETPDECAPLDLVRIADGT